MASSADSLSVFQNRILRVLANAEGWINRPTITDTIRKTLGVTKGHGKGFAKALGAHSTGEISPNSLEGLGLVEQRATNGRFVECKITPAGRKALEDTLPEHDLVREHAYLLTWNPTRWDWDDFDETVMRSVSGNDVVKRWSSGNNRSIQPGERVFLLRQATERGIIGSGYTTSEVFRGPHWDGTDREANYASVNWESILGLDDVLSIEALENAAPGVSWNHIQASGISIPSESIDAVEELWRHHLVALGRSIERMANEVVAPARYIEGAVRTVSVNAYERNPAARQSCIDHWGLDCAVCGFNFGVVYGGLGEGFIHVHHLRDLAIIAEEYEVDPINDLRPVCPNCHAMLHKETPAMSIERLRMQIEAEGSDQD